MPDLRETVTGRHDELRHRAERVANVLAVHAVRFRHLFPLHDLGQILLCVFTGLGSALVPGVRILLRARFAGMTCHEQCGS